MKLMIRDKEGNWYSRVRRNTIYVGMKMGELEQYLHLFGYEGKVDTVCDYKKRTIYLIADNQIVGFINAFWGYNEPRIKYRVYDGEHNVL